MKYEQIINNATSKPEVRIVSATSDISALTKKTFSKWLSVGNPKDCFPAVVIACLDKVSAYALMNKISFLDFWNIRKPNVFKPIYYKLLNTNLLRITDKTTHRMFIIAGQLYLKFLRETPFATDASLVSDKTKPFVQEKFVVSIDNEPEEKSDNMSGYLSDNAIDPNDVIAWLVTQPNANGTLYLESVVRQYMGMLRATPAKFEFSNLGDRKSVFACRTPQELMGYWNRIKATPNYKQVNSSTSGMFSAGMSCYLRYLKHLEQGNLFNIAIDEEANKRQLVTDNSPIKTKDSYGFDIEINEAIDLVLLKKFTNGFRYSNEIELSRLRRLINEQLGKEVILNDAELIKYVRSQGREYAGKIYIISQETIEHIQQLVEDYFQNGAVAIFYAEFYAKHEFWLIESSIVSEEMLTEILRGSFQSFCLTETYFGKSNDSIYNVLQNEILRVWNNEVLLTYEALAERLTYIPQCRIQQHLGQNNDFINNSRGEFTHVSKIDIAEHEAREIMDYIETEIRAQGYASISDAPLNEIIERNYMLSTTAIHNAVYFICLANKYSKSGKIITCIGEKVNALNIIKGYCKTLDRCMLSDLLDFERNLTGESHRWIPMKAGYDVLIRIDENTFVAERYVHFDTSAIDMAIEYFFHGGEYVPLQSVTTFAMFPHCGQTWNLFLLESYCRRFSEDFRFECLSVNSKNVGAIVRKKSQLPYVDIMADAVAKSNIPLVEQSILNFLMENGYISGRRYSKVIELINQVKAMRNK